jgi:starch-binding outer membrane protein, SusD/RagB family
MKKTMKTINFKYGALVIFAAFLYACKKDFVETKNVNDVPSDQFWTKPADAFPTLVPCYSTVKYNGTFGLTMQFVFYGMDPNVVNEGQNYTQYQSMIFFADNANIASIYSQLYAGLVRCDLAIEKIPVCYKGVSDQAKLDEGEVMLGETHFLRAFYSYYITTLFNSPPLVWKTLPAEKYKTLTNTPQQDWYDTIYKDCRKAMSKLPVSWDSKNLGRATKGAAIALMAKTFMNNEKWDSAEFYFNKLIVEKVGGYELILPQGTDSLDFINAYQCNYAMKDLTSSGKTYTSKNNKESIFEAQNTEEGTTWWNLFLDGYGCDGSLVNTYFSIVGYWNIGAADTYIAKFEKVTPSASMPLRRDPRLYASVYLPGDTIRCWYPHAFCNYPIDNIIVDPVLGISLSKISKTWNKPGKTIKKYMYPMYPYTQANNKTDPNNWRLLTYSDVLLYAAETKYQLNKDPEAIVYINEIRNRVGLPDTTASGAALKDLLIHEREVEKGLESSWMLDIMRWARTKDQRTGEIRFADPTKLKGTEFRVNKNEYLPIPQYEIDYMTQGGLSQNTGW